MVIVLKKRPYEVEIPIMEQKIQVLSANPENLVGRVIKIDLTRVLKGKNLDAAIIIKKENDKFVGEFIYLKIISGFIRRMIRKNISYVEDSFPAKTKEGTIIIKPFLLTKKTVHRSVRNALRNKAREVISEMVKDKANQDVFESILSGNMQKEVTQNLKKIYPLSFSEIRVAKLKR